MLKAVLMNIAYLEILKIKCKEIASHRLTAHSLVLPTITNRGHHMKTEGGKYEHERMTLYTVLFNFMTKIYFTTFV